VLTASRAIRLVVSCLSLTIALASSSTSWAQTRVRLGSSLSPPSLDSITPYVALQLGLFKQRGLDVEMVEFRGDATHMRALLAGDVDVAINMGATEAMVAASKGARIKLWVVPQPVTPYHFVARRQAATTLAGLVGKSIAVSELGAISYHIPRFVLERSGLDPDQARYVAVGSPADRFRALVSGKVDAAMVTNLQAAKLGRFPEIVTLLRVAQIAPEIPYEFGMVRDDYIVAHPDILGGLTQAVIEANRWIMANRSGTVEIARNVLPEETVEDLTRGYDLADRRMWGPNGDVSEDAYRQTAQLLRAVGYLREPVPYRQFFDRTFVDRVLSEIGRQ
jgi:NitT/TauT family transport system substrate-binding protein